MWFNSGEAICGKGCDVNLECPARCSLPAERIVTYLFTMLAVAAVNKGQWKVADVEKKLWASSGWRYSDYIYTNDLDGDGRGSDTAKHVLAALVAG